MKEEIEGLCPRTLYMRNGEPKTSITLNINVIMERSTGKNLVHVKGCVAG